MSEESENEYSTSIEEGEAVSYAVLRTVAAVSNQPILELPPLLKFINPDAIDRMFAASTVPESVRFDYNGYHVTVSDGNVCVRNQ